MWSVAEQALAHCIQTRASSETMHHTLSKYLRPRLVIGIFSAAIVVGLLGYAYLRIFSLTKEVARLNGELTATVENFSQKTDLLASEIGMLDERATGLSDTLSAAEQTIQSTKTYVDTVQTQVGGLRQTVGTVSGAVTTLEKLSKTDPELLQKYSKVFFLNEHYAPERVTNIPAVYLYSEQSPEVIHSLAWPPLKKMLDASKRDGITLYVKSAYRSYDEQTKLKSAYTVTYGAGTANQFSADQGYSEHQLGTTVDFITTGLSGQLRGFEKTAAYQWMLKNAHLYGFTLSYPENNGHYIFEPWHWRYVGVKLATFLHNQSKYFYDLEQREIDAYLIHFDE